MQELNGQVAVITGGASGIGLALAYRFAKAGMAVAVGDVEELALDNAVEELRGSGANVYGAQLDVSDVESMGRFAAGAADALGPPHVVCLNAGVASSRPIVDHTLDDWQWVLGVNLWGIVHGLDAFLGGLIDRDAGHVVVTASVAGHTSHPGIGPYNASKHAAVAIAETLYNELAALGSRVGVSALCPGFVNTGIFASGRNRPEHLVNRLAEPPSDEDLARERAVQEWMAANARDPSEVAALVFSAVMDGTFWVFTDDDHRDAISRRHNEILTGHNPSQYESIGQAALES